MKRTAFFSIIICTLLVFFVPHVSAAKVRVRKSSTAPVQAVTYSKAKLSRGTNSIVLTLINLGTVAKVSYELSYAASGIPQGAMGSVVITGQTSDSRDLYFGTCSHGVCTPHYNIKNATLLVKTQLKSGGVHIKRYRIKV